MLSAFSADDHGVSLAGLGKRTGLAKGTLHRVVGDLVKARLLEGTDHGYRLSGPVFELGMRASVERRLLEVATPFMQDLPSAHARRSTSACSRARRSCTSRRSADTVR